jgi:hypothetical protein
VSENPDSDATGYIYCGCQAVIRKERGKYMPPHCDSIDEGPDTSDVDVILPFVPEIMVFEKVMKVRAVGLFLCLIRIDQKHPRAEARRAQIGKMDHNLAFLQLVQGVHGKPGHEFCSYVERRLVDVEARVVKTLLLCTIGRRRPEPEVGAGVLK